MYIFLWRSILSLKTVQTLLKYRTMQQVIWVFTVCLSTRYGGFDLQRVIKYQIHDTFTFLNHKNQMLSSWQWDCKMLPSLSSALLMNLPIGCITPLTQTSIGGVFRGFLCKRSSFNSVKLSMFSGSEVILLSFRWRTFSCRISQIEFGSVWISLWSATNETSCFKLLMVFGKHRRVLLYNIKWRTLVNSISLGNAGTLWHFDKWRLRRACTASFLA